MQGLSRAGVEFAKEKFRFAEVPVPVTDVLLTHNRRHLARGDNEQLHVIYTVVVKMANIL